MKTGGDIIKVKVFVVFSTGPKTMSGKNTGSGFMTLKIAGVSHVLKNPCNSIFDISYGSFSVFRAGHDRHISPIW